MTEETKPKIAQLATKAMTDATFKKLFLENPLATLKAEVGEAPEGLEIKVLENSNKVFHLVLPQNSSELSDGDLDGVAGGSQYIIF
jgi:hypothetical protein